MHNKTYLTFNVNVSDRPSINTIDFLSIDIEGGVSSFMARILSKKPNNKKKLS